MNVFCTSRRGWSLLMALSLWLVVGEQRAWADSAAGPADAPQVEQRKNLWNTVASPAFLSGIISSNRLELSLAGTAWQAGPQFREPHRFFTRRTAMGFALLGSGLLLIKKGFDFHREADELYLRYLDAIDPSEISLLYQRTTRRDLKSQFSWTLGAILAASGAYMVFSPVFHLRALSPKARVRPLADARGAGVELLGNF